MEHLNMQSEPVVDSLNQLISPKHYVKFSNESEFKSAQFGI